MAQALAEQYGFLDFWDVLILKQKNTVFVLFFSRQMNTVPECHRKSIRHRAGHLFPGRIRLGRYDMRKQCRLAKGEKSVAYLCETDVPKTLSTCEDELLETNIH